MSRNTEKIKKTRSLKKGIKRIGTGVLAATALISFILAYCPKQSYGAYGSEEIDVSRQKIKDNKDKLDKLKSDSDNVDAKIAELNKLKSDAAEYIAKLDAELSVQQQKIDELDAQVTELEAGIGVTEAELADAEVEEKKQYSSMKTRIKFMYEHSNDSILDAFLGARSLSDVINRVEYIRKISEYDRKKLNDFVAIKEAAEAKKAELESYTKASE